MKPRAASWRLGLSVAATILLLILLVSAISHPVAVNTRAYAAKFTDASGLHAGADVRVRGVLVGNVASAALERRHGRSVARVAFTLDTRYGIVSTTRLAVKFQTLTGVRYIDVMDPAEGYTPASLITDVPTTMTQPSFDITALFNGLQPVIATLNPDELNTFTANAANFLSGDGSSLASMLDSIRKLTEFMADRQQVVATLMRNLTDVAATMGGHSRDLIQIVDWVNSPDGPIDQSLTILDEFRKSQIFGPGFVEPVVRLLHNAGFKPGVNVDTALDTAFTNLSNTMDAFKLIPAMWENIPPPAPDGAPEQCYHGRAQLPATMDVLLNGRRVVLCNR
jgi:phospholipid/cholesterol/gamma-HCH transport system substrate-binding protein